MNDLSSNMSPDLYENLRRLSEARRMMWEPRFRDQCLATLQELDGIERVALDKVVDPTTGIECRVSTINRESSAEFGYGQWYSETFVYRGDDMVHQDESEIGCTVTHNHIVETIRTLGVAALIEDDE